MRHNNLTDKYLEKMIVREHKPKLENLHPNVKQRWNEMTQPPIPLKYKLQELPTPDYTLIKPLGLSETLPFQVERTHSNNLPVYTDFRNGGMRKVTVVRKLFGDVDEFKTELSKIVSNSPIVEKQGRLEISGFHTEKVKLWLRRLGF
ncbi:ribosomal protein [Stylonychia lemnae]|uniref:Large ribosomal subunit protein mL49 n=1 Tax=Stylonychia lemnae TaxID=5949 RepID=A0A078AIY9_STYLE|nr:ribosomal protein [Stylonychia lemnae]|eukprot:CDW82189.1 ribosomal protein [Stylonychia lemnae]